MVINKFQSLILYLLGCIVFVIGGFILLIISLFSIKLMYQYIYYFCHFLMFCMGVKINIKGKFPKDGTFVIMSNHGSFIDVFVIPPALRGRFTAIIASSNLKIPLFGLLLKKIKAVPIIRENKEAAIKSIKFAEEVIHKHKYHMVILPEGTRTLDGKLQPFKKGWFHMAINTKTSILLVAHRETYLYKPKNRWWLSPRTIDVVIGPVINTENYNKKNIQELIDKTWNEMNNLIKGDN